MSFHSAQYFDCEKFFVEIEKRPVIFNRTLPGHSNKTERDKLWREVCAAMQDDWDEMQEDDKLKLGKNVLG